MISFRKGSHRNTECYEIFLGRFCFGVSYQTIVSVNGSKCARLENIWGPTTGKHLKELGSYDYDIITTAQMEKIYEAAILDEAERILGTNQFRQEPENTIA